MNSEEIRQLIEQGLPGAQVQVLGDDGQHFQAIIVSERFEGMNTLAQHRMVYDTLGDRMRAEIHALSMRTFTPQQWAQTQQRL
jgi:acid stress-induced BolA-like protein IbaG/YrbA